MDMSAFLGLVGGSGADVGASSSTAVMPSDSQDGSHRLGGFVKLLAQALGGDSSSSKDNFADSEMDVQEISEDMLEFLQQLQPLQGQEQQVLEQLADLALNGGLDTGLLSALGEEEINELAQWIADGAGGIFDQLAADLQNIPGLDAEGSETTDSAALDFGLKQKYTALMQLQELQEKLADGGVQQNTSLLDLAGISELSDSELAAVAEDIRNALQQALQAVGESDETDAVAQALKAVAEANLDAAGSDAGFAMPGNEGEASLREAVKNIDADALRVIVENALQKISGDADLPQIPDVVLRSLALEVIKVSEGDATAANERASLFGGLGSNSGLREQLLQELSKISASDTDGTLNDSSEAIIENIESLLAGVDSEPDAVTADVKTVLEAEGSDSIVDVEAVPVLDENYDAGQEGQSENDAGADGEEELLIKALTDDNEDTAEDSDFTVNSTSAEDDKKTSGFSEIEEEKIKVSDAVSDNADKVKSSLSDNSEDINFTEGLARLADVDDRSQPMVLKESSQADSASRQQQMQDNIDRLEKMLQVSQGKDLKNISMELNPRELGRVIIDVSYHEGKVHTTIRTENEAARDMLMSGAEQLKKTLEANGVKIETFDVFVDREGGGEGRNQEAWTAAQNGQGKNRKRGNSGRGSAEGIDDAEGIEALTSEMDSLGVTKDGRVNLLA